jgi:hypothetical protein
MGSSELKTMQNSPVRARTIASLLRPRAGALRPVLRPLHWSGCAYTQPLYATLQIDLAAQFNDAIGGQAVVLCRLRCVTSEKRKQFFAPQRHFLALTGGKDRIAGKKE